MKGQEIDREGACLVSFNLMNDEVLNCHLAFHVGARDWSISGKANPSF